MTNDTKVWWTPCCLCQECKDIVLNQNSWQHKTSEGETNIRKDELFIFVRKYSLRTSNNSHRFDGANIVEQTETDSSYLFSLARVLAVTCNSGNSIVTYSENLQVRDIFQQLGDLSESIERQVQGGEPGNHNTSVLKNTKTWGIWQNR